MLLKTTCWQNWTCRGWSNVPRHPFASCDVMEYLFCIDFRGPAFTRPESRNAGILHHTCSAR